MLAIARGLMARPKLLLVDEPSLGLAPMLVENTFKTIGRINRDGVAILLVEQNVVKALTLANRAFVIENGRMVLAGAGAELLKNEHLKKAYLGM
jgi:branched-chain amino acid transport system ATP-binding protein